MRWEYAYTSRPYKGEAVSGDAAFCHEEDNGLFCGVVDGLGHGPDAAEASRAFVEYVTQNCCEPMDQMMLSASKHISSTRGAAASIMRFDLESGMFEFCGIGNCHLHVRASERISPVSYPGLVGHRIRKAVASHIPIPTDGGLFVLCSDGISSHVHLEKLSSDSAEGIVAEMLEHYGKHHDDATVLVVRILPD